MSRRIYLRHELIGGRSDDGISEDNLKQVFNIYGPIEKIWIARNPPGYAFVNMASDQDAEAAVEELKKKTICGHEVFIEFALEQKKRGDKKPGDWRCRSCGVNNFARRNECFKCRDRRPEDDRRFDDRDHNPRDSRRYSPRRRSYSPRRRSYSPRRSDRYRSNRDRSVSRSRSPRRDRRRDDSVDRNRDRRRRDSYDDDLRKGSPGRRRSRSPPPSRDSPRRSRSPPPYRGSSRERS